MTTLQKLLTPATAAAIFERGAFTVGGPVCRAADVVDLGAAELVAAHGWDTPDGPFSAPLTHVDVLRFDVNALMSMANPTPPAQPRPWPTYDTGFLRGPAVAPVWLLQRTRVPAGAEFWRIQADGSQRRLSYYGGPAQGWWDAPAYRAPLMLVGPRAVWQGQELPAGLSPDGTAVELVWVAPQAPSGFEQVRPGVHRASVPVAECEAVFELDLRARLDGVAVRVVQVAGSGQAQVDLVDPSPDDVRRTRAVSLEPGVFEAVTPREALSDTDGVRRELPGTAGQRGVGG